jgi:hypothetical protein
MATHVLIAMATTQDVRDAFSHLSTVEIEESDVADGLRVALSADEAGQFFKQVRIRGFDAESKRLGDSIVSHIETEREGLGELFG